MRFECHWSDAHSCLGKPKRHTGKELNAPFVYIDARNKQFAQDAVNAFNKQYCPIMSPGMNCAHLPADLLRKHGFRVHFA